MNFSFVCKMTKSLQSENTSVRGLFVEFCAKFSESNCSHSFQPSTVPVRTGRPLTHQSEEKLKGCSRMQQRVMALQYLSGPKVKM